MTAGAASEFRRAVESLDLDGGLNLLRLDAEGRIDELAVMVRPRSGLIALAEAVGPRLAAASG